MRLTADQNGERLDAFLSRQGDNLSRSAAQKLIEAGAVRLNGRLPKKNDRLNLGDTVEYTIPEPKEVDIAPKDIPLEIVYEDEDVAVINKPSCGPALCTASTKTPPGSSPLPKTTWPTRCLPPS